MIFERKSHLSDARERPGVERCGKEAEKPGSGVEGGAKNEPEARVRLGFGFFCFVADGRLRGGLFFDVRRWVGFLP